MRAPRPPVRLGSPAWRIDSKQRRVETTLTLRFPGDGVARRLRPPLRWGGRAGLVLWGEARRGVLWGKAPGTPSGYLRSRIPQGGGAATAAPGVGGCFREGSGRRGALGQRAIADRGGTDANVIGVQGRRLRHPAALAEAAALFTRWRPGRCRLGCAELALVAPGRPPTAAARGGRTNRRARCVWQTEGWRTGGVRENG